MDTYDEGIMNTIGEVGGSEDVFLRNIRNERAERAGMEPAPAGIQHLQSPQRHLNLPPHDCSTYGDSDCSTHGHFGNDRHSNERPYPVSKA